MVALDGCLTARLDRPSTIKSKSLARRAMAPVSKPEPSRQRADAPHPADDLPSPLARPSDGNPWRRMAASKIRRAAAAASLPSRLTASLSALVELPAIGKCGT